MSIFISEITFFIELLENLASNMKAVVVCLPVKNVKTFFCSENLYLGRPKDLQCTFKINRDL